MLQRLVEVRGGMFFFFELSFQLVVNCWSGLGPGGLDS